MAAFWDAVFVFSGWATALRRAVSAQFDVFSDAGASAQFDVFSDAGVLAWADGTPGM